jgi:alpha-pyrone synthase
LPAFITSIGLATPAHRFSQTQIAQFMAQATQCNETDARKLNILYHKTNISYRHSVLADYGLPPESFTFYPPNRLLEPFPDVTARMKAYQLEAPILATQAALQCIGTNGSQNITHLITVSCTGMYAPGLDIDLVHNLGLSLHVERTAVNFMGCYGLFNGLKIAQHICHAQPTAQVLLVSVELCTLHFQKNNTDSNLLANALFADGAAALLLSATFEPNTKALKLSAFHCDLYPAGAKDMAWHIAAFGFEMLLSPQVPKHIQTNIATTITQLLAKEHITFDKIAHFAIHPGGKAILKAMEQALQINPSSNIAAYNVLEQYGNMSSATIAFVLKTIFDTYTTPAQPVLSAAFGPGLTLETMLLHTC